MILKVSLELPGDGTFLRIARRFLLTLEYHADRVAIIVRDQGKGFSAQDVGAVGSVRPATSSPDGRSDHLRVIRLTRNDLLRR